MLLVEHLTVNNFCSRCVRRKLTKEKKTRVSWHHDMLTAFESVFSKRPYEAVAKDETLVY